MREPTGRIGRSRIHAIESSRGARRRSVPKRASPTLVCLRIDGFAYIAGLPLRDGLSKRIDQYAFLSFNPLQKVGIFQPVPIILIPCVKYCKSRMKNLPPTKRVPFFKNCYRACYLICSGKGPRPCPAQSWPPKEFWPEDK